jgi:hypothetical protein
LLYAVSKGRVYTNLSTRVKGWTEKYIQELKDNGKIQDYRIIGTKKPANNSHNLPKNIPKRNKTKEWIALNLSVWCNVHHFTLIPEYPFCEGRKWRADFFIQELNCIIEYEGLMSAKSRHTTVTGFSGDTDKYNEVAKMGFILIRVTVINHKSLFTHLEAIKNKPQ